MTGSITIELKGLRFFSNHGMYHEELKTGNEFELDVLIDYRAPEKPIVSINETINYVEAYEIVRDRLKERTQLLETLAMQISDRLQERFRQIEKITVSIKKLTPPLTNFIGSLGISYTRLYK